MPPRFDPGMPDDVARALRAVRQCRQISVPHLCGVTGTSQAKLERILDGSRTPPPEVAEALFRELDLGGRCGWLPWLAWRAVKRVYGPLDRHYQHHLNPPSCIEEHRTPGLRSPGGQPRVGNRELPRMLRQGQPAAPRRRTRGGAPVDA